MEPVMHEAIAYPNFKSVATLDELYETCYRNEDLRDNANIDPDDERDTDDVLQYFESMTDQFSTWITSNHIFQVVGDKVYYNLDRMPLLRAMIDRIAWEYDALEADGIPDTHRLWKLFQLGGDDDVDYNGGYLANAIDILERHEEQKTAVTE
jgi:hypothetical protein